MKQSVVIALSVGLFLLLVPGQCWCNRSAAIPICGKRNPDGITFRDLDIQGGKAIYGEFPWMMAVIRKEQASNETMQVYQCGGSLIHPKVVLTAAHTIDGISPAQLMVRAGEWDSSTEKEIFPHQDRNVSDVAFHPEYYRKALWNDVALLFLDSPVTLGDGIQTICLPPPEATYNMQSCFVTGWEKHRFGILRKAEVALISANECQSALRATRLGSRFELHSSFICAGRADPTDSCWGDGGSPLVCPIQGSDQQYLQVCIGAWGFGCDAKDIQGVYANVALVRGWIDQELQKKVLDMSSYNAQKVITST